MSNQSEIASTEKTHVPRPGYGAGLRWRSYCGVAIKTRTGDVARMQRQAQARAVGSATDPDTEDYFCPSCLQKIRVLAWAVK